MSRRFVIKGARVIDPATGLDGLHNIYVMAGRIASIKSVETDSTELVARLEVIDAAGLCVTPGFVDLHCHLRDPGYEYKETIETGAASAAAGGFTTICCMANTSPVNDNESITRYILKKAEATGVNVRPIGALTHGQKGERLTDMHELKTSGCVAISDDGVPVTNPVVMRKALEYAVGLGMPVVTHAEDHALAGAGVMNEGAVATRLGLKGIPNVAEDAIVARDIMLAELTGARLHIAHVSTAGSVELIRNAKKLGIKITAEVTPHHLTLTDESVAGYDTNFKMNPPLRAKVDMDAVRAGLADGTIDCVATDHAPHSPLEKDVEFDRAANGIIGFETAFGLVNGLVNSGVLSLNRAIEAMTCAPARAFGLDVGSLRVGASADMVIIDLKKRWRLEPSRIVSRSRNTPWAGVELTGRVLTTISNGKTVYHHERG